MLKSQTIVDQIGPEYKNLKITVHYYGFSIIIKGLVLKSIIFI